MSIFFSLIFLLLIASGVNLLARRIRIPYTILLFVVGVLVVVVNTFFGTSFLLDLQLTPELLFYVFLPTLIFESGYNINRQQLAENNLTIWTMATFGLLLSVSVISSLAWLLLSFFGFSIPFAVILLFAVAVSATDPVAVLSIFKQLGMPARLTLLFEGESLFNDGTAVAIFLVLLELYSSGVFSSDAIGGGVLTFFSMVLGGIVLGFLMGIGFSKVIQLIHNNEVVEISLTMILAHFTFLIAEYAHQIIHFESFSFHISGVIATAFAAIVMGNYGKTKISPKVERYMHKFWNFFAYISNSLVFLLMGLLLADISLSFGEVWLPLLVGVGVVWLARAVSVYIPLGLLNFLRLHRSIPSQWLHLLAWGSLRGALGIVLILIMPDDFSVLGWSYGYTVKEFLLVMTIGAIVSSLVLKGLTLPRLIRFLGMNKLRSLEHFEKIETDVLIFHRILDKIKSMEDDYDLCEENYLSLADKYRSKLADARVRMRKFLDKQEEPYVLVKRALSLHALGVEKQYLKEMFSYHECDEYIYLYMLGKIERQVIRIEKGDDQIYKAGVTNNTKPYDFLMKFVKYFRRTPSDYLDHYVINRTRFITTDKVISLLHSLQKIDFGYDASLLDPILSLYQWFHEKAQYEIAQLQENHPECMYVIHTQLLNKGLMKTEEHLINDLFSKEMVSHKVYQQFMQEIEHEIEQRIGLSGTS